MLQTNQPTPKNGSERWQLIFVAFVEIVDVSRTKNKANASLSII